MDAKTRLHTAFDCDLLDRPPILGGWLAAPSHVQSLTGCSQREYWDDPLGWGIEAKKVLGSDGLIIVLTPVAEGEFRCVDQEVMDRRAAYSVESLLAEIDERPDVDELRDTFDEDAAYDAFLAEFNADQARCDEMLWCPADWKLILKALWYHEFGYETALMMLPLHADRYLKLLYTSAEIDRQYATLRARAMREGIHPRAILKGEISVPSKGRWFHSTSCAVTTGPRWNTHWSRCSTTSSLWASAVCRASRPNVACPWSGFAICAQAKAIRCSSSAPCR